MEIVVDQMVDIAEEAKMDCYAAVEAAGNWEFRAGKA